MKRKFKINNKVIDAETIIEAVKEYKEMAPKNMTIEALRKDEEAAIDAYKVAIENLQGVVSNKAIEVLQGIMKDEIDHLEKLDAILYGREENVEVDEHKEITEDSIKDKMDKSSAINKMKSYISKLNSLVNGDWNKNDLYDVVLDMRDLCEEAIYREGAFYDSVKDDDSHMIPSEIISKLIREGKWDNRTKVKYMGKVNINGKEQDKFIYGIPGGNIQYALYLKENKFQGIAQQNSNVNLPDSCKR